MGNNNNQNQTSPVMVALVFAFIIVAAIFTNITDSMIVGMSLSFLVLAGLAGLVYAITNFWKKADKKKLKKYSIIIGSSVLLIFIVIGIANAFIPKLTQGDVVENIKTQLQPQLDEIENKLGVSDLSVELYLSEYEYKKPTLFSKGRISFKIDNCYKSNSFTELDNGVYNADTYSKYNSVKALDYDDIKIDNYIIYIDAENEFYRQFKDSDGDQYTFGYNSIYKNKNSVYSRSSSSSSYSTSSGSSYSSSKKTCPNCNGTGRVKYYSGQYDAGTVGTCTMCKGTGRV